MAVSYEPIRLVQSIGQGFPRAGRGPENSAGTFNLGVPLQIDGDGMLLEFTASAPTIVYGVNNERPHNLAVDGTAEDLNEGDPPNQPSAVTTPVGAWMRDGKLGYYAADGRNIFSIMMKDGQTFTDTLVAASVYYGLTKDATSGFWYLDSTDTSGDNAVATLLGVDPSSPNTAALGARVYFQFKAALRFFD